MSGPSLRIDHVAFPSFDTAATHRFYTEVLGFELVSAWWNRCFGASDAQRGRALLARWCGDAKLAP